MKDTLHLIAFLAFTIFLPSLSFGQLHLKLELMADSSKWGVYVTPDASINPSQNTITGSGQVTLVLPTGYQIGQMKSVSGNWDASTRINNPIENPTKDYLSFGLLQDFPQIYISKDKETLLFTIERIGPCPTEFYIIENYTDPFANLPNSVGINPGNDLGIFDSNSAEVYHWTKNYDMCAWSCAPCNDLSSNKEVRIEGLEIFPNPSTGAFTIDLGSNAKLVDNIVILNSLGQSVFKTTNIKLTMNFELNLMDGMYFIALNKGNKTLRTTRVIISK